MLFPPLSRRREHLHARALQIRAELSTHIDRETGPQRPTHSFWSFLFEKTKLERRRAECVCEAESELESVVVFPPGVFGGCAPSGLPKRLFRLEPVSTR